MAGHANNEGSAIVRGRRQFLRFPAHCHVAYEHAGKQYARMTSELSSGGLFVLGASEVEVGDTLRVELRPVIAQQPIELTCLVSRVSSSGAALQVVSAEHRRLLRDLIETRLASELKDELNLERSEPEKIAKLAAFYCELRRIDDAIDLYRSALASNESALHLYEGLALLLAQRAREVMLDPTTVLDELEYWIDRARRVGESDTLSALARDARAMREQVAGSSDDHQEMDELDDGPTVVTSMSALSSGSDLAPKEEELERLRKELEHERSVVARDRAQLDEQRTSLAALRAEFEQATAQLRELRTREASSEPGLIGDTLSRLAAELSHGNSDLPLVTGAHLMPDEPSDDPSREWDDITGFGVIKAPVNPESLRVPSPDAIPTKSYPLPDGPPANHQPASSEPEQPLRRRQPAFSEYVRINAHWIFAIVALVISLGVVIALVVLLLRKDSPRPPAGAPTFTPETAPTPADSTTTAPANNGVAPKMRTVKVQTEPPTRPKPPRSRRAASRRSPELSSDQSFAMSVAKKVAAPSGRVSLGVRVRAVDEDTAMRLRLPRIEGALVTAVWPGTPAERAGIRESDVILSVDGRPVRHARELPPAIAQAHTTRPISLKLWRDGAQQTLHCAPIVP